MTTQINLIFFKLLFHNSERYSFGLRFTGFGFGLTDLITTLIYGLEFTT